MISHLEISNKRVIVFHPVSESDKIVDKTRALTIDSNGNINIAVFFANDGWYDEGSICYDGGEKIYNVIEFALI